MEEREVKPPTDSSFSEGFNESVLQQVQKANSKKSIYVVNSLLTGSQALVFVHSERRRVSSSFSRLITLTYRDPDKLKLMKRIIRCWHDRKEGDKDGKFSGVFLIVRCVMRLGAKFRMLISSSRDESKARSWLASLTSSKASIAIGDPHYWHSHFLDKQILIFLADVSLDKTLSSM